MRTLSACRDNCDGSESISSSSTCCRRPFPVCDLAHLSAQRVQKLLGCRSERRIADANDRYVISYLPSAKRNHGQEACPELFVDRKPAARGDAIIALDHKLDRFPGRQLKSALRGDSKIGESSLDERARCRTFLPRDQGQRFKFVA